MAIDTAEKRRSVSGLLIVAPGVTPNANKDAEWRQQAGFGYYGLGIQAAQPYYDGAVFALYQEHRAFVYFSDPRALVIYQEHRAFVRFSDPRVSVIYQEHRTFA